MGVMPGVTWRPVPSHSGPMRDHLGLVLHVQVGDGSCYGEFANPANQASSTWWVPKHGTIGDLSPVEQYVDSDVAAWTEAAGNFTWDSVETEGTPDEPLTDYQVWAVGQIYLWGHDTYGWPFQLAEDPLARGLGWHGMGGAAWGGHFGCPGDLRKAQRPDILVAAQPQSTPPTPQENDMQPAIVRAASGQVWYFVVGLGEPYGSIWAKAGPNVPWDLGGQFTSGCSAAELEPGVIQVCARGTDGYLWHKTSKAGYDFTGTDWAREDQVQIHA